MPKKVEPETWREQWRDQLDSVNDRLQNLQEKTTDYVAENPAKSTLMAFGFGLLAGAVIVKLLERK